MNLWKVDVDHLHQGSVSTFVQGPGCFMPWSHYVICYLQLLSIAVEVFHRTWPIRQHRKEVAQAVHVVCALICFTKKKRKKENECVWEDGLHWKHATSCWYCGSARTHAHKYILYICVWIRTETTSYCQAPVNFIFKTDRWQHITRVLLTVAALSN